VQELLPRKAPTIEYFYIWAAFWQYGEEAVELIKARKVILAETILSTNS
jgi:hypothetical protein